ncbi:MAG: alpha-amylase, partial [Candidatus Micrarchaeota archaeon]
MVSVCVYFQVHQPMRLRKFSVFESGEHASHYERYFNDSLNREIFLKVARKCYFPTNSLLLDLVKKYDGKFKISYSLTGVFMEQCKRYAPELLDIFKALAETGCVDFLNETYYHSLSSLFWDKREFLEQIRLHKKALRGIHARSEVFRNT